MLRCYQTSGRLENRKAQLVPCKGGSFGGLRSSRDLEVPPPLEVSKTEQISASRNAMLKQYPAGVLCRRILDEAPSHRSRKEATIVPESNQPAFDPEAFLANAGLGGGSSN